MSQARTPGQGMPTLTGLLLPLADRTLLVPNVAVAELVAYRTLQTVSGMPDWFLGQLSWRDLRLPLLSFERASAGELRIGSRARVVVLNALGGRDHVKFLALLVQDVPRSIRVDATLQQADAPLAPLELAAVRVNDGVAKIPDLAGLEELLVGIGLI